MKLQASEYGGAAEYPSTPEALDFGIKGGWDKAVMLVPLVVSSRTSESALLLTITLILSLWFVSSPAELRVSLSLFYMESDNPWFYLDACR